jgi:hypothetical protein
LPLAFDRATGQNKGVKIMTAIWRKIWGPAGIVLMRPGGSAEIYATQGTSLDPTGDIYAQTVGGWEKLGGPGKTFAVGPSDNIQANLVGLSPDGKGVWLRELTGPGGGWEQIGGPAKWIYAGDAGIFATNPQSGDIYQYNGTPMSWTRIGGPGKTFAAGSKLFGLSPDGSGVYQYDGTPMHWTKVGGPAAAIFAGSMGLCATDPNTHDLWRYS